MESPEATSSTVRNARAEAQAKLGSGFTALVLEPSPPAVTDGPFFADDPVAADSSTGTTAVAPTGLPTRDGVTDWAAVVATSPELAGWAAERWLAGPRRLPTAPDDLVATRLALHRLAAYVVAPVRHAANTKFGLRYTAGGFGTPFFADPTTGADTQIRIEGTNLVLQQGDQVTSRPITTLGAAAQFLATEIDSDTAAEHDSPEAGDPDETLAVSEAASRFLGHWFGMAFAGLESLRADPASVDPSRPQLWPGHFDAAIEVGDEDHRASYGASTGDAGIPEPYLYVSVWWPDRLDLDPAAPEWNAPSFTGAILKLSDFPADTDPAVVAADFWKATRDRLG